MIEKVKFIDTDRTPLDDMDSRWSDMNGDVMELVFSKLPQPLVRRAGFTCKRWNSVANDFLKCCPSPENLLLSKTAFFRVGGVKYSLTDKDGGYLIESVEDGDRVPIVPCEEDGEVPCLEAAGGLFYAFTGNTQTKVHYKLCHLESKWRVTSEIPRLMQDPVVGVVVKGKDHKLVFAGGEAYHMEDGDGLAVSIYDRQTNSWETCEPLPQEFSGNTSSLCMGSVVHRGRFYAYDRNNGCVSPLDTDSKRWCGVKSVSPPSEVNELFLLSQGNKLCLVGIQNANETDLCFKVWNVDEETMQVGDLLHRMIILTGRPTPPSATMRRIARVFEPLARCVGLLIILLVLFMRLCSSVMVRIVGGIFSPTWERCASKGESDGLDFQGHSVHPQNSFHRVTE